MVRIATGTGAVDGEGQRESRVVVVMGDGSLLEVEAAAGRADLILGMEHES